MTETKQEKSFTAHVGEKDTQQSIASQTGTPPHTGTGQTASTTTPQSPESAPHLNPRSCVTCRKRKVRCDKHEPCGNCSKAGIDCHFPAPGRAPRKPRKPLDAELLKRLKRLEGVVSSLGAQVDEPTDQPTLERKSSVTSPQMSQIIDSIESNDSLPEIGRLVISRDKSRYVSNNYWASLENEIDDIKDILDQSSDDDEIEHHTPESVNDHESSTLHGFLFGFSSLAVDMKKLYPSPSQIFIIWEIFKENIDPVCKVLHCPSVKNLILKAAVNTDNLARPSECLFFAICFGAIISMSEDQCKNLLGDTKINLWKKYRFATEQALARANFLNSSSLVVLQSLIFYLICLRYLDDSKSVWGLGGLAIHQGYTLGLHRDGTHFGLDPFECEMRRRLWWHISILDVRAAEDHGTDLRTSAASFDTHLPTNVNDDDIWPGMKEPPTPAVGTTEMTFCLVRFELSMMTRKLNLFSFPRSKQMTPDEVQEKEEAIDMCHQYVDEKYIRHCNMNTPIYWVTATVGRLILAKMWLKLHHPRLTGKGLYEHPDVRERVFLTSIEVVEFGYLLESNDNTAKWAWLFRTYMQWHSVAHVLSELAVRGPGSDTDRGWRAIESIYEDSEHAKRQRGMLWKPIRQLYAKAMANRKQHGKEAATLENGTPVFDAAAFLQGSSSSSAIAASANALGIDFERSDIIPAEGNSVNTQTATTIMPLAAPTTHFTTPEFDQQTTPDLMSWDDWDMTGTAAQPIYPFGFDNMMATQEWF